MSDQLRIAIAGGGGARDSRLLDEVFAAWIGSKGKLLYWPFALRGIRTFESCWEWITTTFAPFDLNDITMWTGLSEHQTDELERFDGVYVGGGNTFSLLAEIRECGFAHALQAFARRGKPVYGGSAGAAVLGRDMRTVTHIDHNHVGLVDTTGLDLAEGYAVWVHYQVQDDDLIRAYVQENQQSVVAISERSGITIENGKLHSVGLDPAFRFDIQGKIQV